MKNRFAPLRQLSSEVFYADGNFRAVGADTIALLKDNAARSPRRRSRLCFHAGPDSAQQEMLIVVHRDSYVRPHRHLGKTETLAIVEGVADTVLFDDNGAVADAIRMSPAGEGGCFFYRMPERLFHTLVFRSEWLVFIETTIGPFDPAKTEAAPWAPPESEPEAGRAYLATLRGPGSLSE